MLSDTPTLRDGGLCSLALKLGVCYDCFEHGHMQTWPEGTRFQPQALAGWPRPFLSLTMVLKRPHREGAGPCRAQPSGPLALVRSCLAPCRPDQLPTEHYPLTPVDAV